MKYEEIYTGSIDQPEILAAQADEIEWYSKPETILSKDENGYPLRYKDGELNICYLTLRQTYSRWIWRSNRFYL
jgi:propionyl-CoA synthetase